MVNSSTATAYGSATAADGLSVSMGSKLSATDVDPFTDELSTTTIRWLPTTGIGLSIDELSTVNGYYTTIKLLSATDVGLSLNLSASTIKCAIADCRVTGCTTSDCATTSTR